MSKSRTRIKQNVLAKQNATAVLLMLIDEGVPLKEGKELIFRLWEKGEISFLKLEQERRKVQSIPCSHTNTEVLETVPIEEARLHHIIVRRCHQCATVYQRVERIA